MSNDHWNKVIVGVFLLVFICTAVAFGLYTVHQNGKVCVCEGQGDLPPVCDAHPLQSPGQALRGVR